MIPSVAGACICEKGRRWASARRRIPSGVRDSNGACVDGSAARQRGVRFSRHGSWSQEQGLEGGCADGQAFASADVRLGSISETRCTGSVPWRDASRGSSEVLQTGRTEHGSTVRWFACFSSGEQVAAQAGVKTGPSVAAAVLRDCSRRSEWSESSKSGGSPREHRAEPSWQRDGDATDSWRGHPPGVGARQFGQVTSVAGSADGANGERGRAFGEPDTSVDG